MAGADYYLGVLLAATTLCLASQGRGNPLADWGEFIDSKPSLGRLRFWPS